MGSLRKMKTVAKTVYDWESTKDAFGCRVTYKDYHPNNAWYWIDTDGHGHVVEEFSSDLIGTVDGLEKTGVMKLRDFLEDSHFSQIVVEYDNGTRETYLTYRPDEALDTIESDIENALGEMQKWNEACGNVTQEWDAGEWLAEATNIDDDTGTATIDLDPQKFTITAHTTDAELQSIAKEIERDALEPANDKVIVRGAFEYLADLRDTYCYDE
jgi:hypothetical protein